MMPIHRLVTDAGFIREFWRRLREMRESDPSVTQEAVFDILNEEYKSIFHEYRFKSFDAFRKRRDRATPK
jgi:hypothetical protein